MPDVHSVDRDSFQNAYSSFHHHRLPLSSSDGLEATKELSTSSSNNNNNNNNNRGTNIEVLSSTQQSPVTGRHGNDETHSEPTHAESPVTAETIATATEGREEKKPVVEHHVMEEPIRSNLTKPEEIENERRRLKVKEVN